MFIVNLLEGSKQTSLSITKDTLQIIWETVS